MKVRVEVTIEDVVDGASESECNCAIALAMKRALPGHEIEVWSNALVIDGTEIHPPAEVLAFIEAFDAYRQPDPISFDVEIAEAVA